MWKIGDPEVYGNYIVMLKDGTVTQDYYASFGWDDNGSNVVAYTDYLDRCGVCDEDICNDCKFLKQVYGQTPILHFDGSIVKVLEPMDKRIVGPHGGELVEVVRCKDCKKYIPCQKLPIGTSKWCDLFDRATCEMNYCGWAERKEDAETN